MCGWDDMFTHGAAYSCTGTSMYSTRGHKQKPSFLVMGAFIIVLKTICSLHLPLYSTRPELGVPSAFILLHELMIFHLYRDTMNYL